MIALESNCAPPGLHVHSMPCGGSPSPPPSPYPGIDQWADATLAPPSPLASVSSSVADPPPSWPLTSCQKSPEASPLFLTPPSDPAPAEDGMLLSCFELSSSAECPQSNPCCAQDVFKVGLRW
jgi:hypothetical protein